MNLRQQDRCCELCRKQQSPSKAWTLASSSGEARIGYYCTRECAFRDCWGPMFRGYEPVKYLSVKR